MRYKITIEYDGSLFHGFQFQEGLSTIQGSLEQALLDLTGEKIRIFGAGRTDQGVHAFGQVAHFDMSRDFLKEEKLQIAINHFLNTKKIAIVHVEKVDENFHARFSALMKQYRYRIINRLSPLTLDAGRAWHVGPRLDFEAMNQGAKLFLGHHDFSSFRDSNCQGKTPFKTVLRADVEKSGDEITFIFESKSFLHHQVRNMVGTLKLLGHGKLVHQDIITILDAKDRKKAGPTAPPDGLYLTKIFY